MTVEFLADGKAAEIVLTHERLSNEMVSAHTGGWTDILNGLAQSMGEKAA